MLYSQPKSSERDQTERAIYKALDQGTRLFMVVGPTGIGKSALALDIADAIGGEVVSVDAFQVYKGFDIGTAKLPVSARRGIPHHLIDICDPMMQYTVKIFSDLAHKLISTTTVPLIFCGGTGLYCDALLYSFNFLEEEGDDSLRHMLQKRLAKEGKLALYQELYTKDPVYAMRIDAQNPARILRGLAVLAQGKRPSEVRQKNDTERRTDICCIGMRSEWDIVTSRIHRRTQMMMAAGWAEEVRQHHMQGISPDAPAFKALGYQILYSHLQGLVTRENAIVYIQTKTRQFAKRQMTWFKRYHYAHWLSVDNS